jgi:hypothetical protein
MNIPLRIGYFNPVFLKNIPNGNAHSTAHVGNPVRRIADPDTQFHVDRTVSEIFQLANRFWDWYKTRGMLMAASTISRMTSWISES